MALAAVSGSWSGSGGGGFGDDVGGLEGGSEGSPEPIFRRFSYDMILFFGMVLFLYQGSTQVSTFGGPREVTKVTMADDISQWVRLL